MMMNLAKKLSSAIPRITLRTHPGARPGTVTADEDALPPQIQVIRYGADEIVRQDKVDVETLPELIGTHAVIWINVCGLGDASVITRIGELFKIHRLALEDVVNVNQRAKAEEYEGHVFVVARMPPCETSPQGSQASARPAEDRQDEESDATRWSDNEHAASTARFDTEQLSLFLGRDFVITFQERPGDCFDLVRDRLSIRGRPIREAGADYLAYALLDAIIDNYFPVLDTCGQRLDELDDLVSRSTTVTVMSRIHEAKADIRLLRRVIWPHREMIHQLMEKHADFITDTTRLYLRDVYDHTIQVIDILETYRESCSDLRDFYMSAVSNRMNEVMKVLTIIATIFIPLGFIAGIYGMNFDSQASPYNMPELSWLYGYPMAIALMLCVAIGMLFFFRRKGWLGSNSQA